MHVMDRMFGKMDESRTPLCVGLDPVLKFLPQEIKDGAIEERGDTISGSAYAIELFNRVLIDVTCDLVGVYKPQMAFYEQYGPEGVAAFIATVDYARRKGAFVIEDAKRIDLFSTAEAYAEGHLGEVMLPSGAMIENPYGVDMITVAGYMGSDGINPFSNVASRKERGAFVIAKTSNPSAEELQDLVVEGSGLQFYVEMAKLVDAIGRENLGESGYSNLGIVVGATKPEEAALLREMFPHLAFLMPGYGNQGAAVQTLANGFDEEGKGAAVNSSSAISFPLTKPNVRKKFLARHPEFEQSGDWRGAIRQATLDSKIEINGALASAGKLPAHW
jgi:orotidine-5'-phosphate decarboxylase